MVFTETCLRVPMLLPPELIQWADQEMRRLRSQLDALESGRIALGSRFKGEEWIDITREEMARLRRNIADLQAVLNKAQDQNGG
jgi:hypothetical protein